MTEKHERAAQAEIMQSKAAVSEADFISLLSASDWRADNLNRLCQGVEQPDGESLLAEHLRCFAHWSASRSNWVLLMAVAA